MSISVFGFERQGHHNSYDLTVFCFSTQGGSAFKAVAASGICTYATNIHKVFQYLLEPRPLSAED